LIWTKILADLEPSGITHDQALVFARQSAVLMLKISGKIDQRDTSYVKSMKETASFFEVEEDTLELLIDSIAGNPVELFKVQNKQNIEYSLNKEDSFAGNFDPLRMAKL
jgi:hypothetical protein